MAHVGQDGLQLLGGRDHDLGDRLDRPLQRVGEADDVVALEPVGVAARRDVHGVLPVFAATMTSPPPSETIATSLSEQLKIESMVLRYSPHLVPIPTPEGTVRKSRTTSWSRTNVVSRQISREPVQ